MSADDAYERLSKCNVHVNAIRIPSIRRKGLRLGAAEITRMGMEESEIAQIATFVAEGLDTKSDVDAIRRKVIEFSRGYQNVHYSFDDEIAHQSFNVRKSVSHVLGEQNFHMHEKDNNLSMEDYKQLAEEYAQEVFLKIPGFLGMIVRGGVGRGTADKFSDIDFTCIFDCEDIETLKKEHGLKTGMHIHNGIMFSGRYIALKDFKSSQWSDKMKHAYSYVECIGCDDKIMGILTEKTQISDEEQLRRVCSNIIELGEICKVFETYHGFSMFSEIFKQYERGEINVAHLEVDRAIKYLKNIIFDLNKVHYPEDKSYYVKRFSGLPLQPFSFDDRINEILCMTRDSKSLELRVSLLVDLAREVLALCEINIKLPDDIYRFYLNTK